MLPRQELERDQRRPAAGWALILEPAPEELGLLPEAELPDRAVGNGTLSVVARTGRRLELFRPLCPEPRKLALGTLLGECGSLRGG
jgi:hypothetical protein